MGKIGTIGSHGRHYVNHIAKAEFKLEDSKTFVRRSQQKHGGICELGTLYGEAS